MTRGGGRGREGHRQDRAPPPSTPWCHCSASSSMCPLHPWRPSPTPMSRPMRSPYPLRPAAWASPHPPLLPVRPHAHPPSSAALLPAPRNWREGELAHSGPDRGRKLIFPLPHAMLGWSGPGWAGLGQAHFAPPTPTATAGWLFPQLGLTPPPPSTLGPGPFLPWPYCHH